MRALRVAVTGGKGGTGKSFVATNLAAGLSMRGLRVVLLDLDMEAPNDHVLLGVGEEGLRNPEEVVLFLPFIDYGKCTLCGVCGKVCDTGAILVPPKGFPVVFPRLCSGCRACLYACPYGAILEGGHVLAHSYVTPVERYGDLTLVTGVLVEGEEHVPPGLVVVKRRGLGVQGDVYVVDTGAGTGNSISIALQGSDLVIAVTEPTPLGAHDLRAILEVTRGMGLRTWVVVNRYGVGSDEEVLGIAGEYGVERVFRIPFSRDVVESYVEGVPLVASRPSSPAAKSLFELIDSVMEVYRG